MAALPPNASNAVIHRLDHDTFAKFGDARIHYVVDEVYCLPLGE